MIIVKIETFELHYHFANFKTNLVILTQTTLKHKRRLTVFNHRALKHIITVATHNNKHFKIGLV